MSSGLSRRDLLRGGAFALAAALVGPGGAVLGAPGPTVRLVTEDKGHRVRFDPVGLLVPLGATVTWRLAAGVHTVTAYHPDNGSDYLGIPEGATPWDSGYLMREGETFRHTFEVPGVYDYFCRPHEAAGMVGRLVVTAGASAGPEPDTSMLPAAARAGLPPVRVIVAQKVVPRWPA